MAQYEMGLRDYWRILRKRKLIVISTCVIAGALTYALTQYVFRQPPSFRATARVSVKPGIIVGTASPMPPPNVAQESEFVKSEMLLKEVVWVIEYYPFYAAAPASLAPGAGAQSETMERRLKILNAMNSGRAGVPSAGRAPATTAPAASSEAGPVELIPTNRIAKVGDLAALFRSAREGAVADVQFHAERAGEYLQAVQGKPEAEQAATLEELALSHFISRGKPAILDAVVTQFQDQMLVRWDAASNTLEVEVRTFATSFGGVDEEYARDAVVRLTETVTAVYKAYSEWEGSRAIEREIERTRTDLDNLKKERKDFEEKRRQKQEELDKAVVTAAEEYQEARMSLRAASEQFEFLKRYVDQLDAYAARRKELDAGPADKRSYGPIPAPAGIGDPNIQALYSTSALIEKEKNDKLEFYKPDSHVIAALDEKIGRTAGQLRLLIGAAIENQTVMVKKAEDRFENAKKNRPIQLRSEIDDLNLKIGYLVTNIAAMNDRLSRLNLYREQGTKVRIDNRPSGAESVDRASAAAKTLVGAFIGLLLGVVLAVFWETLDLTIGTIEEVETFLETRVLGVIPHIEADRLAADMRARNPEAEAGSSDSELAQRAMLVTLYDPKSVAAESFRHIRTTLDFATSKKQPKAKVLLVTSATLFEGKTFVAANLAVVMAQNGKRTCLVEADLRRPRLHHIFGVDRRPGLHDVFIGKMTWQEARKSLSDLLLGKVGMEAAIRTPGLENLSILTCGAVPPNPVELLGSAEMARLFAELREAYDVVILDSPPALPVADAAVLSPHIDGAILVYRAGSAPRTILSRAKSQLESTMTTLFGVVLNDLRPAAGEISATYPYKGYLRKAYALPEESEPPRVAFAPGAEEDRAVDRTAEDAEEQVLRRVDLLLSQARAQEAIEAAHEGARAQPDSISIRLELARACVAAGRTTDAQAELIHVLDLDPRNLPALERLAELASDAGLEREALRWYEEILEFDPGNARARQRAQELRTLLGPASP